MIAAAAAAIAVQHFRYERTVQPRGPAVVEIRPDGPLYAHTRDLFADLRILDAQGRQVPWQERQLTPDADLDVVLPVLDSGRRGDLAVARVRTPRPVERVTLVVRDRRFVGVATAYGSSDGTAWTKIGSTQIYAVGGARPARSTTVLLRPNDFHYLELRATGVSRILRVTVRQSHPADLVRVPARVRVRGGSVVVDLGYAKVPVDELRISSTAPRYDRAFTVVSHGAPVAAGRLVRLRGPGGSIVPVSTTGRIVRVLIANGNDPPLRGLQVTAWARPRPLLLEGGHPGPLTLYYGAQLRLPDYEFARLPVRGTPRRAALGPERPNPDYRLVDTRSFFARHRSLVTLVLALGAVAVLGAATLALRRT